MFAALVRWFGSGKQRPAHVPSGLRFTPRLEDLEGRAEPGGLAGISGGGDPFTTFGTSKPGVINSSDALGGHGGDANQVDLNGSQSGIEFGVGVDLCGSKVSTASGEN